MVWQWLRNKIGNNDVATYWLDVQMGPSEKRYSIVKSIEFVGGFGGSFFLNQKKCIKKGKQYRWLVYNPRGKNYPKKLQKLEKDWNKYKKKLDKHDDDLVQCRVLVLEEGDEPLSWNFTMYEKEVCIVERSQEISFGNDDTIIILDADKAEPMEKLFEHLWNVCPSLTSFIKSDITTTNTTFDLKTMSHNHSKFAHDFFRLLGSEYHKHVPISHGKRGLQYAYYLLIFTIMLVFAAVLSVPFKDLLSQLMSYFHIRL